MPKLKIEDLDKISQKVRKTTLLREGAGRAKITVHMGTCGIAAGAREIMNALLDEFDKKNIVETKQDDERSHDDVCIYCDTTIIDDIHSDDFKSLS